jgi:hypothetical protein
MRLPKCSPKCSLFSIGDVSEEVPGNTYSQLSSQKFSKLHTTN